LLEDPARWIADFADKFSQVWVVSVPSFGALPHHFSIRHPAGSGFQENGR
jgi:hypothetical protein